MQALKRLLRIFQPERWIYLIGSCASLILFFIAGYKLFTQGAVQSEDIALIFGASGISAFCSGRIGFFLSRTLKIIRKIIIQGEAIGFGKLIDSLELLMQIFRPERVIYLLSCIVSSLLFVYAFFRLLSQGALTSQDLLIIFGASGTSAAVNIYSALFFNQAFRLIEDLTERHLSHRSSNV